MTAYDEHRLAELIKALPPAPQAWVEAAQELPLARGRLDEIVARAEADLAFRDALIANLEEALRLEGYEPDAILLDELRRRLESGRGIAAAKKRAAWAAARFQGVPACCGLTSEPVLVSAGSASSFSPGRSEGVSSFGRA